MGDVGGEQTMDGRSRGHGAVFVCVGEVERLPPTLFHHSDDETVSTEARLPKTDGRGHSWPFLVLVAPLSLARKGVGYRWLIGREGVCSVLCWSVVWERNGSESLEWIFGLRRSHRMAVGPPGPDKEGGRVYATNF